MFLAHTKSVAGNTFSVLPQYNKFVLANHSKLELVSNVCPHQKSIISIGSGSGNRVCPYHNWTFTLDGQPVTSGRTEHYCKNQTALQTQPVHIWNSLVFSQPVDFKIPIDFSNLELVECRVDLVKSNYINIMVVYDEHGLAAAWIAVYPYTMIEWQRGSLFVTVAENQNTDQSNVHVFKYTDNSEHWPLNNTVWETAWKQDRDQAELISEINFENLEYQKRHYRNYLKENGIT